MSPMVPARLHSATGFPPAANGAPRKQKPYVIHVYSRQTMVGGAAEPRLQATHRDRCTDSRARMSPRGVDSLESSSLAAREGRLLAGASALGRAQEKDKVGARAPIRSFCDDIGGLLVSEPKWRAVQWCGASGRSGTRTVVGRCSDALWVPLV